MSSHPKGESNPSPAPSLSDPNEAVAALVLRLAGVLARRSRLGDEVAWNETDVDTVGEMLSKHRLGAALYRSLQPGGPQPPESLVSAWREEYQRQLAIELLARNQLEQLAHAFSARGVDFIALKGAASLLWVQSQPGVRGVGDLDLLVKSSQVPDVRQTLTDLGFLLTRNRNPVRDELVLRREPLSHWSDCRSRWWPKHLNPYHKPGRMSVELHVCVPRHRGAQATEDELWPDALCLPCGGAQVHCLSPIHFILHACVHLMFDLHAAKPSLKSLVDICLAISRAESVERPIDWDRFWATARSWGVAREVGGVIASVNRHWEMGVPGVPADVEPLSASSLVYGLPQAPEPLLARIAETLDQIRACRELSNLGSQVQYLRYLAFPPAEYLRATRKSSGELAGDRARRLQRTALAWMDRRRHDPRP